MKADMSLQEQGGFLSAAGGLQDKRQVRKQPGLARACLTGECAGNKARQGKHFQHRSGTFDMQDDQSGSPSPSTADSSPVMTAAAIRGQQEQAQDNDASELQVRGIGAGCTANTTPARGCSMDAGHTQTSLQDYLLGQFHILVKGLLATCDCVWPRHLSVQVPLYAVLCALQDCRLRHHKDMQSDLERTALPGVHKAKSDSHTGLNFDSAVLSSYFALPV